MERRNHREDRKREINEYADNRPIKGSGSYNLNFIDWENEYEAVIDHVSNLQRQGLSYEQCPYYDVPSRELEFLWRDCEELSTFGLSDEEIARFPTYRGQTMRECTICLSASAEGIKLPCGHVFHKDCIVRWLKHRTDCPNCRRSARVSSK
ncbi:RNF115_1 [Blepharisma stoltei]|uniref:RING-type domain-containing protein n=1 Tax=Blepharisma stoltei TaxID=1481888 RepID=A0AAU9ISB4_9CILI|nr:unnamed protein product [Blepharisma stoltei]